MYFTQIFLSILTAIACVDAKGYNSRFGALNSRLRQRAEMRVGNNGVLSTFGGRFPGQQGFLGPKPYSFGYQAADSPGSIHYRKEQAGRTGSVRGSYGYMDSQGLYRHIVKGSIATFKGSIDYIANKGGFRANVKTNEPGTDGKKSPVDVNINSQTPPVGVQGKYSRQAVYGVGYYGSTNHASPIGLYGNLGSVNNGFVISYGGFRGYYGNTRQYSEIASAIRRMGSVGTNFRTSGLFGKYSGFDGSRFFAEIPRSRSGKSAY